MCPGKFYFEFEEHKILKPQWAIRFLFVKTRDKRLIHLCANLGSLHNFFTRLFHFIMILIFRSIFYMNEPTSSWNEKDA